MAHEIEHVNGKPAFAYSGEPASHGIGRKVPHDLTAEQMLQAAQLDWNVEKMATFINLGTEENPKYVQSGHALVRDRDNKVLSNVSNTWEIIQNSEAADFFHDFVMAGDMEMHTAGSLKGGTIVWFLARVKEDFTLFNGDTVESYLLFTNYHMYGRATDIRFTPIRVVCNNTLTFAMGQAAQNAVKISHKKKFDSEAVKTTLGIAKKQFATYKQQAEFLGTKKFDVADVKSYFNDVFPSMSLKNNSEEKVSKPAKRAFELLEIQPGAEYAAGTYWQAFNAITFMLDHEVSRTAENRLTSAWYGQNQAKKLKALKTAVAYAEAA